MEEVVGQQEEANPSKEMDHSKSVSWADMVVGPKTQKRKMQLVFHPPDESEELIMVLPP